MVGYSIFRYWASGAEMVEVEPDPPTPEEAKPFWVLVRSAHYIPISLLVFARDEDHAWKRVETALQTVLEKDYPRDYMPTRDTVRRVLEELASGVMKATVTPADISKLCYEVNWASNGGL